MWDLANSVWMMGWSWIGLIGRVDEGRDDDGCAGTVFGRKTSIPGIPSRTRYLRKELEVVPGEVGRLLVEVSSGVWSRVSDDICGRTLALFLHLHPHLH